MLMFHIEVRVAKIHERCHELQRLLEMAGSSDAAIGVRWSEVEEADNVRRLRVSGTHGDKAGSFAAAKSLVDAINANTGCFVDRAMVCDMEQPHPEWASV